MTPGSSGIDAAVVDLGRVAAWMQARGLGTGPLEDVRYLGGGTQNVLIRFRRDGRDYVLRRPPEHKRANSDDTINREARVLAALADTDVPHPRLIAACDDGSVIGASFYLMDVVDGFNPTIEVPALHTTDVAAQAHMGRAIVDGALALARIDPVDVGLSDLGQPDGWLERQVPRWRRLLNSYGNDGQGDVLPHVEVVGQWLANHQPRRSRRGIIHGDFHIANMLIQRDGPGLAAIVDWELVTQGDPLLDLGHLLVTWPRGGADIFVLPTELEGLPTVPDLVDHYAAGADRDLNDLDWFRVLACYRLAIIIEGTHVRSRIGKAPEDVGTLSHQRAVLLLEHAMNIAN